MKKTSLKKVLSMAVSLVLLVSVFSAFALTAGALPETGVQDLGDSFIAALTLRYQNVALSNNGDNTVSAVKYNGVENEEPAKDVFADAQLWKFEKQENGSYKITSKLDDKCFEVVGMGTENVSPVGVWESNDADCQRFFIYTVYGKYVLNPAHAADKVVDVNQANFSVHIYDYADDKVNEQFHIEIVEVLDNETSEDETSEVVDETSEVADETSEVADETSEVADETSEEAADTTSEEAADTTSEEVADTSSEELADTTSEEAADTTSEEAADTTSEEATSDATSEAPVEPGKPGDAGMVVFAVIAVLAAAAAVVCKKIRA